MFNDQATAERAAHFLHDAVDADKHLVAIEVLPAPTGRGYGMLVTLTARIQGTQDHQRCLVTDADEMGLLVAHLNLMDRFGRSPVPPRL